MHNEANIAAVAALLADPARSRMLMTLLDGRALTASELARKAQIGASTASTHLAKLVAGDLLAVERQGRHRYYRIARPEVARVLETLATIAPPKPIASLREAEAGKAIHFARTCYDHMAGHIGVALAQALVAKGWLLTDDVQYALTPAGESALTAFGIDLATVRKQRRALAPCCLDWSERRHHMAGALGAALANRLFELDWIRRLPATRALYLPEAGRAGLAQTFGIEF